MTGNDYTAAFTVDRSPAEAYAAITDVRGWWSAEVDGPTAEVGDVFVFTVPDVHRCSLEVTEAVPGRRIVWRVSDSWLSFVSDTTEWDDTDIVFDIEATDDGTEVRFTHVGLAPAVECYDICTDAWGSYLRGSLRGLITTGEGYPYRAGGTFDTEVLKHAANREAGAA
jgi:uncharacterized protein YndB with AHSA1/START domain